MANASDIKEAFPTTESLAGAGVTLTSVNPGQATAGTNGQIGFSFQDNAGNAVLPKLDLMGNVPVTIAGAGITVRAKGQVGGSLLVAGSAPGVYSGMTTLLSIPITVAASGKMTNDMHGTIACRRDALFQLVYQDAGSVVLLDEALTGPGQYTTQIGIPDDVFMVPASAVSPQFLVRAGCFATLSDMHSALKVTTF